jgi:hypothetical protein
MPAEGLYIISYPTFLTEKSMLYEITAIQIPTFICTSLEAAVINVNLFLKCCLCEMETAHLLIIEGVIYGKHLTL